MYVCVYLIIYNYIYMFNVGIDIIAVFVCCDVEFRKEDLFHRGWKSCQLIGGSWFALW